MSRDETVEVRIGLHEVSGLRWPPKPLAGDGTQETVAVPLPRLPWAQTAIEVPLGAGAARAVERVARLRKIFGYVIAPAVILLFLVADALLLWGRFGNLNPSGSIFLILGLAGVVLIATGLVPDQVARMTGAPYITRHELRFPAARPDMAKELVKRNPKAATLKVS